jgi:hypothetical protein
MAANQLAMEALERLSVTLEHLVAFHPQHGRVCNEVRLAAICVGCGKIHHLTVRAFDATTSAAQKVDR